MKFRQLSVLIRLPNLIIAALTILLVYYKLIFPHLILSDAIHNSLLLLEITNIVLIMAGGYIFNDICDESIDSINKPNRQVVGIQLSVRKALRLYWFSLGLTFAITIFLFTITRNGVLALIHLLAMAVLFWYSKHGKGLPLLGNITVALLSALLIAIPPLLYYRILSSSQDSWREIVLLFMAFSFVTTLFRELIKDLEDLEGDQISGLDTIPIKWSPVKTKILGIFYSFILILLLLITIFFLSESDKYMIWYLVGLLISILYLTIHFWLAKSPNEFHSLSQYFKLFMIQGLSLLLFF
ncbi:MAG: UbiA family prenyltransferase [Saprospiraceae bacterium]|nr:UbiA family prenyltransferase [Saprospiraceae bacterium]